MRQLGLYLLTCPHRTTEGIYRLPLGYMATDLGWPTVSLGARVDATLSARVDARLDAALSHLTAKDFVAYDAKSGVVFLPKALKYQRPDNENQIAPAVRRVMELPETPLIAGLLLAADKYAKAFAQALRKALPQALQQGYPKGYGDPTATATAIAKEHSLSDSDESATPRRGVPTVAAAKDTDWQARADAILAETAYPHDYQELADLMASANKTGKVSLARVVRELYEPLRKLETECVADAMRAGLRAAITKGAPNANYVLKAAASYATRPPGSPGGIARVDALDVLQQVYDSCEETP